MTFRRWLTSLTHQPPSHSTPRVLFVDSQVADFLHYRMSHARRLRNAGFDVQVALPKEPGVDLIAGEGFPVHTFYLRRLSTWPVDEVRCWYSLLKLYRRVRPTLVHHFCLKPVLYGGIAARVAGVPAAADTLTGLGHIFTTRTPTAGLLRALVRLGLRYSFAHDNHRVIFQNQEDLALLRSSTKQGDAVIIRGSGVDLSVFTTTPEAAGPRVVIMASRLLWTKGVGEFVAAARELRRRGFEARFVLLGEPDPGHPSAVPMRTLCAWRDAGDVEWEGWSDNMAAAIARCHIVCLPSSYGEGVPRILLEAAASGRPIVVTDTPGCRDIVRHGINGLIVQQRDHEALVRAIAQLIEDAPLRATMGALGREIAVTEFSLESAIAANLAVYRSLLPSVPIPSSVVERL